MSGKYIPRATCLSCKLETTISHLTRHKCFGADIHEHPVLYKYWRKKPGNAQKKGLKFFVTGPELISLVEEAGITPEQIGPHKGEYNLARINDEGDYIYGRCRFILMEENLDERKDSSFDRLREVNRSSEQREKQRVIQTEKWKERKKSPAYDEFLHKMKHSRKAKGAEAGASKAVIVKGKKYHTLKDAAKDLGITRYYARKYLNSDDYPEWIWVDSP